MKAAFGSIQAVSAEAAAYVAHWVIMHPHRRLPQAKHWKQYAPTETFDFKSDGKTLAGYRWGSGQPVLLCHGWDDHAAAMSQFVDPLVAAGYAAIAFDAPAHGASRGQFTSVVGFARAIDALAEIFGSYRGIIGHSIGAVAATLAVTEAKRNCRLALLAPPPGPACTIDMFSNVFGLNAGTNALLKVHVAKRLQRPSDVASMMALAPECAAPALVVHDQDDHAFPIAHGRKIAEAFVRGEFVATQGLGHRGVVSDPDVIKKCVAHMSR